MLDDVFGLDLAFLESFVNSPELLYHTIQVQEGVGLSAGVLNHI